MKRRIMMICLAALTASGLWAQASSSAPATAAPQSAAPQAAAQIAKAEGQRYVVYSERGRSSAEGLVAELDGLFALYNSVFRFDPSLLGGKLTVREFASRAAFDAYLQKIATQTRDDYVYIHYPSAERRELLVFPKDEPDRAASLAHQAFIQFLKAFVQNPPLWLRDGFAVAFETARWDADAKRVVFPENLAWLEAAKALDAKGNFLPIDRLLTLGAEESRSLLDVYYPEAWAFVSFLANDTSRDYNRFLWDTIAGLRREASLAENQAAVKVRLETWYGTQDAAKALSAYLASRKTYPELVADGVRLYGEKEYVSARKAFEGARELDPSSYVVAYYLGLIAYATGDYVRADFEYQEALRLGCEPAIAHYALGLNAYVQNRAEDARRYLAVARDAAPERYRAKVEELLGRLK